MSRYSTSTRILLALIAALALLIPFIGCGGGAVTPAALPIDDQLFVPNYILSLENNLFHWNHLPVRVRFVLPANWQQLYPQNPDLHVDAASEWNQPGLQALTSVVTIGEDVVVQFVSQDTLGGDMLGKTSYSYNPVSLLMVSAQIQIALDSGHGTAMPAVDIQATIAHEIGHAMGIGGHSPYPGDLMYSTHTMGTDRQAGERDLNTAMTAYAGYFGKSVIPYTRTLPPDAEIRTAVIE